MDQKPKITTMIGLCAAFILMLMMITGESFWIDEGDTALYAMQPNFTSWLHRLVNDTNADCQMPLTMFTSWLVGITLGTGEWVLRAQNFIFGGIALFAMYAIGQRSKITWLPLLLAFQPYFWFYMDEARPYVSQIAGGSFLLWILSNACLEFHERKRWVTAFLLAAFLTFTTSMLTAVTIAVVCAGLMIICGVPKLAEIRKSAPLLSLFLILSAILAVYYSWTIDRGAKGARIWVTDWKALGFIGYEFIGATGLGPSLDNLRNFSKNPITIANLIGFVLPVLFSVNLGVLFSMYGWSWFRKNTPTPKLFAVCTLSLLSIILGFIILSFLIHKPLWARHLSPALPMLVLMEGMVISTLWNSKRFIPRFLVITFLILLALSSLNIRFHPQFSKDDYRSAAQIAKESIANNQKVWWNAAEYTALYYDLHVEQKSRDESSLVMVAHDDSKTFLEQIPAPDVIILTRPEVYDPAHFVQDYATAHGYTESKSLRGFKILEKPILK